MSDPVTIDEVRQWRDAWYRMATCTEPADRVKFERSIRKAYDQTKHKQPRNIVFVSTPLVLAIAGPLATSIIQKGPTDLAPTIYERLHIDVAAEVRDAVAQAVECVKRKVPPKPKHLRYTQPPTTVSWDIQQILGRTMNKPDDRPVEYLVVRNEVNTIFTAIERSIVREVGKTMNKLMSGYPWFHFLAGQFNSAFWYMRTLDTGPVYVGKPMGEPGNQTYWDLVSSVSWFSCHENFVMAADRPTWIKLDERQRLHCTDGPALTFGRRDGKARPSDVNLWSFRGVEVPRQTILRLDQLDGKEILAQDNAEVRRVLVEHIGFKKFLGTLMMAGQAQIVNADPDPQWGILYKVNGFQASFVKVRNCTPEPDGTFKDYVLVAPQEMKTAKEAVLWTQHLTLADHNRLVAQHGHWRS